MSNHYRNTATRDRHRATIKRNRPPCALCGQPIDYSLHHLDPGAFVVDHIVSLAAGGADVIENKQAAHRSCNRAKGAGIPATPPPLKVVRQW